MNGEDGMNRIAGTTTAVIRIKFFPGIYRKLIFTTLPFLSREGFFYLFLTIISPNINHAEGPA